MLIQIFGARIEEDKVAVTGWNGGSLILIGDLVTPIGTEALYYALSISIGAFVTTCYSSLVLSTDILLE